MKINLDCWNIISLCLGAGGPQGKPLWWPVAGVFVTLLFFTYYNLSLMMFSTEYVYTCIHLITIVLLCVFQSYKNIKERAQCTLQDPELLSGALIDVAKHLGNLKFRVWEKMLEMVQYTPVVLDPNTAAPWLSLSDLTTVRHTGTDQKYPANPERFSYIVSVLGSEGFTSGTHSWEVKVGNKYKWDIGVVKESISRKGSITCSPERGFWVLTLRNGDKYYASGVTDLTLKRKPQSIRVQLDYDRGEVSFFNSSDMSLIYTFKDTFTERVFPYFSPCLKQDKNEGPLQICPVKISVKVTSNQ
ncbi:zinc-binding protein A33-like [Anguilla rostrata]|uniref:zinc-binding protein A33-like n=1 Tax=Anguilla rostrata TaxID=7938 RepID=UPI0030D389CC